MFSTSRFAVASALLSLVASVSAGYSATSKNNVAIYYGQGPNESALGLHDFCANSPGVDIIPLAFLDVYPAQGNGYPGTNFASSCTGTTFTAPGYNNVNDPSKDDLQNNCPTLVDGIAYCQSLQKQILLSVGGAPGQTPYQLTSTADAEYLADFLWGAFGPLQSPNTWPRPFDTPTVSNSVDGFDFDIETIQPGEQQYYITMINRLIGYFPTGPSAKKYLITGAPQCITPDNQMADMITAIPFDILFVQYYNTAACSARSWRTANPQYPSVPEVPSGFSYEFDQLLTFLDMGASKNAKILFGLPGAGAAATNANDYLSPTDVAPFLEAYYCQPRFGGVMVWEGIYAYNNNMFQNTMKNLLEVDAQNPSLQKCPTSPPPCCTSPYTVVSGDYCYLIASQNGLTTDQFYALNPSLGPNGALCGDIQPGQTLCLARASSTTAVCSVSTASKTTTTTSATPTPSQCVTCTQYHTVASGEYCYLIWTNAGISSTEFYALNPTVNCNTIQPGNQLCIAGTVSSCPTSSTTLTTASSTTTSSSTKATSTTSSTTTSTTSSSSSSSTSSSTKSSTTTSSSTSSTSSSSTKASSTSSSTSSTSSSTKASTTTSSSTSTTSSSSSSQASTTSSSVSSTSSSSSTKASTTTSSSTSSTTSSSSSSITSSTTLTSSTTSSVSSSSTKASTTTSSSISTTSSSSSSSSTASSTTISSTTSTSSTLPSSSSVSSSSSSTKASTTTSSTTSSTSSSSSSTKASNTTSTSSTSVSSSTSSTTSSKPTTTTSSTTSSSKILTSSSSSVTSSSLPTTSSTSSASLTTSSTSMSSSSSSSKSYTSFSNSTTSSIASSSSGISTASPVTYTTTTTSVYTVTSCPPTVTNCPLGHVTTDIITITTTYCPANATTATTTPTAISSPAQYTTSVVYTTLTYTITACPSTVTDCPALGSVTTETKVLYTTICPVNAVTTPVAIPTSAAPGAPAKELSTPGTPISPSASSSFSLVTFSTVSASRPTSSSMTVVYQTVSVIPEASISPSKAVGAISGSPSGSVVASTSPVKPTAATFTGGASTTVSLGVGGIMALILCMVAWAVL